VTPAGARSQNAQGMPRERVTGRLRADPAAVTTSGWRIEAEA
jgi:hypothetical protein